MPALLRTAAVLVLVLALPAWAAPAAAADPAGHWEGAIALPGQPLTVKVDLVRGDDGAWRGTIDIPQQGAAGLPLAGVRVAADSVTFAIADVPGRPLFRGALADTAIAGDFSQGGMTFPFRLGREALPPPARPQEPRPPFPYTAEEVGYASGEVHLAATLTLPPGDGPFPAAVLLTGSGAQNRDEELFGHKPFAVLADHLTRRGIAVLRADDRGVGGSTGQTMRATTADFAADALAGVRFLRARPEIAPGRIGLIGHSEGGIVAPLAAVRAPDEVAFLVLLAGTGVPLGEVVEKQQELIMAAAGADPAAIARAQAQNALVFDLLRAGADSAAVRAALEKAQREAAAAAGEPVDEAELATALDASLRGVLTPWFRYALTLDPRVALRQVACPVLALNGGRDLQVDADQNLAEIEQALAAAGNPDVTALRLPGLNHLFQEAATGLPDEYGQIEQTMAPAVLDTIAGWIGARFGVR